MVENDGRQRLLPRTAWGLGLGALGCVIGLTAGGNLQDALLYGALPFGVLGALFGGRLPAFLGDVLSGTSFWFW